MKTCNDAGFSMVAKNLSSLIESENRSLISAIFRALLWCAWVCASLSSRLRLPWLTIVSLTNGPRTCRGTTEPETSGPGWPFIWLAVLTKTLKRPVRSGCTKIVETSWRGSSPVVASYFLVKIKKYRFETFVETGWFTKISFLFWPFLSKLINRDVINIVPVFDPNNECPRVTWRQSTQTSTRRHRTRFLRLIVAHIKRDFWRVCRGRDQKCNLEIFFKIFFSRHRLKYVKYLRS